MDELPSVSSAAPYNAGETSLIEIVNGILRDWRTVLALPLVFGLVAGTMSLNRNRSFSATASFLPQTVETRGVGGAAALAQQFGVNLGPERPGQSPQFYEGLLRTTTILRRAVESDYRVPTDSGQSWSGTLLQYWHLDQQDDPTPPWRRGVGRLRGAISTSVRRETGVVELKVSSDKPLLAELVAARLLELLNDYNLEVRQARARDEARFVTERLMEAHSALRAAEDGLEGFLRRNRNFRSSPELTFEHDRLQRQVLGRQEVYIALLRAQEQARIDGMRETPVLQVIDSPTGSGQPNSRKVVLRTLIAFLIGLLLAVGLATAREVARRGRSSNDPYYREFEDLVRRAWSDLRHPRQWLSRGERSAAAGND